MKLVSYKYNIHLSKEECKDILEVIPDETELNRMLEIQDITGGHAARIRKLRNKIEKIIRIEERKGL